MGRFPAGGGASAQTAMNEMTGALRRWLLPLLVCGLIPCVASLAESRDPTETLDLGYRRMYSLDFVGAERAFSIWEQERPEDPRGPVSEAAGFLFSELHRLGVLEAQFFVDDDAFTDRKGQKPDPSVKVRMDAALGRADTLARKRLGSNPEDADALFALALASGLQADYLSLIEARNIAALSPTKHANEWAEKLLRVDPGYADAYLATGLNKYIIGSTPAPIRWVLAIGGYSGDKSQGIRELEMTAEKGRLLAPFARLLLSMAYLRQGHAERARQMLERLQEEFPENPLYEREIARIAAGKG